MAFVPVTMRMRPWTRQDVVQDVNHLYIFGDNDLEEGYGGQACIRGLCNAMGIPTKKLPEKTLGAYYTDDELEENMVKITAAIDKIKQRIQERPPKGIIFSAGGLGTGLSLLPYKAPQTYLQMNILLQKNFPGYKIAIL